jgi:hypothetical protein
MGSVTVTTDGCLPAALDRLYGAVGALVDAIKEMHDGAIVSAPSLYEQLVAAIPTKKGDGAGRRVSRSAPPVWTDALALRIEIDATVRGWLPDSPSTGAPDCGRWPPDRGGRRTRAVSSRSRPGSNHGR